MEVNELLSRFGLGPEDKLIKTHEQEVAELLKSFFERGAPYDITYKELHQAGLEKGFDFNRVTPKLLMNNRVVMGVLASGYDFHLDHHKHIGKARDRDKSIASVLEKIYATREPAERH